MKPQGTDFRLARTSGDYRRCHQLVRELSVENKTFSFPTILAERDGELIGLLGTVPSKDAVIAGPLVVNVEGNRGPVMIRLIEAYDNLLRGIGVVVYMFRLPRADGRRKMLVNRALGLSPCSVVDGFAWYKRELK